MEKLIAFLKKQTKKNKRLAVLSSLHDEKFNFLMNLTVHVLLKTNQVEVPMMGLQADYSDAILLHPHVLQELNSAIRVS